MSEQHDVKLEKVHTAQGQLQAHVIKGKLESEGIPVLLQYESQVFAVTVDGLGEVRIMVPEHLANKAREIIARTEPGDESPCES
jgi:type 1 glutamine amidotransferase